MHLIRVRFAYAGEDVNTLGNSNIIKLKLRVWSAGFSMTKIRQNLELNATLREELNRQHQLDSFFQSFIIFVQALIPSLKIQLILGFDFLSYNVLVY